MIHKAALGRKFVLCLLLFFSQWQLLHAAFEPSKVLIEDHIYNDTELQDFTERDFSYNISSLTQSDFFGPCYVITSKPVIPWNAKAACIRLGFEPIRYKAIVPSVELFSSNYDMYLKCIPESMHNVKIKEKMFQQLDWRLTIKEVGLICSHRTIIKKIAKGERKYQTEWALIFEDDAALNPEILEPKELVNMTLRHIDAQPDSYGFMYFGYKYGSHHNDSDSNNGCRQHNISNFSFKFSSSTGGTLLQADCAGFGTHAYAMTTKRAQSFIDEIWSFGNFYYATTPQIDQLFKRYFERYYDVDKMKEHNYVLCPSVVSPEQFRIAHSVHRGIVYQSNMVGKGAGMEGSNLRDGAYGLNAKKLKEKRKRNPGATINRNAV